MTNNKAMFCKLAISLLLSTLIAAQSISYDGYKIYDINARSAFEKEALLRISENPAYDFFLLPRALGVPARVMVPPKDQPDFESLLIQIGISYSVVNNNFGESVQLEREQNNQLRSVDGSSRRISFKSFHRFDTVNFYLDELAHDYSSHVFVKTVGKSYEGREIKTITITNGDGRPNKKVILVDAGIHAREWIAPATALYVIHQLVENYLPNAELLKDYDWIILPVVNPDGYEYTHTSRRMWRKTRKPVTTSCSGTDGNRNFDFHWGEVGASSISCADTYKGRSAFSEPETRVLRDVMLSLKGRAKFYLTIHSYGNYFLYPWGFTSALPSSWQDMDEVAQAGAAAIRSTTGTKYTVGSSTNVLYAAAGGSDDYAFAKANIPIAITMELPGGGSGFDPSPAEIQPFVEESWVGIRAMAKAVINKY